MWCFYISNTINQQKVMFVFKVNNQPKGTNTCLLRKYVFIVNFPIFTTCSLLYVATIAADKHVKLLIAAVVHTVSFSIVFILFQIIKPLFSTPVALSEEAEHHRKLGTQHRIRMVSR